MLTALPAHADNIRFTPPGISWSDWDACGLCFVDPVPIPGTGFRLTYHGGGDKELVDPVHLIIGVPQGAASPTVAWDATAPDGFTNVTVGPRVFEGTWSGAPNFVYDFLGDPFGNNSQNYPNWTATGDGPYWHDAGGTTAWDIYVFPLVFAAAMNNGGPDWAEFTADLVPYSYLIGYACIDGNKACENGGGTESTPFTGAGFVTTSVPEPSSLLLLGVGIGVAAATRRRRSSPEA
jgi:hypothetical protein